MNIKNSANKTEQGFTIAEVSIATAVFAIVLLIALTVFFGISRLFYKGVSGSQTQQVVQQIVQDINGSFQNAANISGVQVPGNYSYYCIGNTRFIYNLNHKVNVDDPLDHSPGSNYGILTDTIPGNGSACAPPCSDTGSVICQPPNVKLGQYSDVVELLGNNMRVSKFDILPVSGSPNLYNISIVVAYGDDDSMDLTDITNPVCKTGQRGSEFCSVNRVDTTVFRGFGL